MRIYLSAKRVLLVMLCSALVFSLINISELSWSIYILSLMASTSLLSLYMLRNLDIVLMRRYRLVNALSLIYAISALFSDYSTDNLTSLAMLMFLLRVSLLPFIEIQREKGHIRFFYKVMASWLVLLIVANDILMVIMPGRFYGDGISKTFLLGSKFETCYAHICLLLMVCLLYGQRPLVRRTLPLQFVVVCLLCRYMDCNTATLGTIAFFVVAHSPEDVRALLSRKSVVLVVLVFCALFVYSESLFLLPPIKYFITEILGRDITLTGRSEIYEALGKIIRAHPWVGYGDAAEIMSRYTGAFNAQNGYFDLVVQNGIPSASLYVLLTISLMRPASTKESGYLLGVIYGYFIMSTVEITFGSTLTMFGILLFTETGDYPEESVTMIEWEGEAVDTRTPVRQ